MMVFPIGRNQLGKAAVIDFVTPDSGPMVLVFGFGRILANNAAGIKGMGCFHCMDQIVVARDFIMGHGLSHSYIAFLMGIRTSESGQILFFRQLEGQFVGPGRFTCIKGFNEVKALEEIHLHVFKIHSAGASDSKGVGGAQYSAEAMDDF